MRTMVRRTAFRFVKYALILVLVSLCYVTYFKSTSAENHVENSVSDLVQPSAYIAQQPKDTTTFKNEFKRRPIAHLASVGLPSTEPNKTLDWLDLWANDTVCNQFSVHLLEDNAVEPRTLVSFPGSGNTWLRMLLMGLTGIYIDTVYDGDEKFPTKGSV